MATTAEKIKSLTEERGNKTKEMDAIFEGSEKENRAFNAEEKKKYDGLKTEVQGINERLSVLVEKEKRDLEAGSTEVRTSYPGAGSSSGDTSDGGDAEKKRMMRTNKWTWKRALSMATTRNTRDGAEYELDREERAIMQECGVTELQPDSIIAPAQAFAKRGVQRRDMDATTATAAPNNEGSFTIQTNVEGIVDVFLPEMVFGKLPVMRLNNLRGNVQFPQAQTLPSTGANTENGGATEKTPKLAKLNLSPKRNAAYIQLSNQLLNQSEANVQRFANRFLVNGSAITFEKQCLVGGGSNESVGILGSTSNYQAIYAGGAATNATNATGAAPVWADAVNHIKAIKAVNSPDGQAFITSPAMKGKLQITPRQSGGIEGNFILREWNSGMNGYPVLGTTNLPDTFTKGGTVILSAMIFGDFSNFVVASWGGLEIGVDPYVNMKEGLTNIVLNSYMDCGVLNPNAFSAGVDYRSY